MDKEYIKVITKRFFKAFVSGMASSATIISIADVNTWTQLGSALNALAIVAVIGGVNGVLMATEKAINYTPTLPQ